MELLLIGANHRTASVDVRGRMTTAASSSAAWFANHAAGAGVAELAVLATCHRVEVVAVVADAGAARSAIVHGLLDASVLEDVLYAHRGEAAVLHLARVACGLDSIIVGEAEISGQIRRALAAARGAGTVGPVLTRVVAGCLAASGRARSATRIGQGTVSAAGAAVSILERAWGGLAGRSVLVVGAGEAARQALHRLRRRGASRLVVASRSPHHARQAAERYGATAVDLDALPSELLSADGVIAATRASGSLVAAAMFAPRTSGSRLLQIVDLSVPRVVDAEVGTLAGIALYTVDDLGDVVRESLARRAREIPRVERLLAAEAAETYRRFVGRRERIRVA
jgi:glutamyl-tRNA reductase